MVLLQHPRERHMPIGTARMASLCLPNSELHVGFDWSRSPALARALSDPSRPAALLYPGERAVDVMQHPPDGPVTLVVIDGTWSQSRKVLQANPALAALPRYAFNPTAPSDYRIRREPQADFVSTLEALMYVLGAIERDAARFAPMMAPFRAMIDAQIACEKALHQGRVRKQRGARPPRAAPSSPLKLRAADVVCVAAEANAWPRGEAQGPAQWPVELVQWAAHRVSTGESFEALVAPRHPLAPGTAVQTGLAASLLAGGETLEVLRARWRAFVRDDDFVCAWGDFGVSLFEEAGGVLPAARIDLRKVARAEAGGNVGAPADYLARLGGDPAAVAPMGHGRAGLRVAQLAAIAGILAK